MVERLHDTQEARSPILRGRTVLNPEIIYEDKNFLAVLKPAGMLTHPHRGLRGESAHEPTLTAWLLGRYPEIKNVGDDSGERPGIVHRLDKETSGVLLVARSNESFSYLKSLFKNREIQKTYLALVRGRVEPQKGRIEKPIGLKNGSIKRSVRGPKMKMVKDAVTEYRVVRYVKREREAEAIPEPLTLLEVMPLTGRTHQIRVHLASIGHPILYDPLYGSKVRGNTVGRLMLHASSLEFTTMEGKRIKIEADPPADFQAVISTFKS